MEAWSNAKWDLKVHVDLYIGVNDFITMIFTNLDDHSRAFENGPYFLSTT